MRNFYVILRVVLRNFYVILIVQIFDPYKTQYGVVDAQAAVMNLAQTSMRSEIGKMQLDGVFSERENLNKQIVTAINDAAEEWGIKALRLGMHIFDDHFF